VPKADITRLLRQRGAEPTSANADAIKRMGTGSSRIESSGAVKIRPNMGAPRAQASRSYAGELAIVLARPSENQHVAIATLRDEKSPVFSRAFNTGGHNRADSDGFSCMRIGYSQHPG
jgi:hypothetical protein